MNKFKVGEKVKVIRLVPGDDIFGFSVGSTYIISGYFSSGAYYLKGKSRIMFENQLEPVERTIEDVQEGDLITNGERFRRVLGRAGQAVFLTLSWSKGGTERFESTGDYFSITGLKNEGWQIVTESTPEVKEMTVADVEKLVGTKVKIVK